MIGFSISAFSTGFSSVFSTGFSSFRRLNNLNTEFSSRFVVMSLGDFSFLSSGLFSEAIIACVSRIL
jgi:hypothetical protein